MARSTGKEDNLDIEATWLTKQSMTACEDGTYLSVSPGQFLIVVHDLVTNVLPRTTSGEKPNFQR